MTIGLLNIDFLVPEARSLKDKRRVLRSVKDQVRARFNCAVAETEHQDLWQRGRLSMVVVSGDSQHANSQLNEILHFVESRLGANIADCQIEMI